MDTKLKNRGVRKILTVVGILAVTVGTLLLLPGINYRAQAMLAGEEEYDEEMMNRTLYNLYAGCYVLYYEIMNSVNEESLTDVFENETLLEKWEQESNEAWSDEEIARRRTNS